MRTIYILSQKRYEGAENLPVIVIRFLDPPIDLAGVDALIFTSKNGVEAIDRVSDQWREIPVYAIGSATAESVRERGGSVYYEAKNSYGNLFAGEIKKQLKGKRTLFVRPKKVTSKLNQILLQNGVELQETIAYETICNDDPRLKAPKQGAVIIFSSPSTIECFFKRFAWEESYRAVVIGDVTAASMPKEIDFLKAQQPTIPACIDLAKRLNQKRQEEKRDG